MTSLPQVVILAGGLATRLRPLTETIPKSLVSIVGEPFIAHQLRLVAAQGGTQVLLCLGHLGEQVQDFVADGARFGLDVRYSFDGATPLGTGGALRRALPQLEDTFMILYGDSYLTCDWGSVAAAYETLAKKVLMTVLRNEDRWGASNIDYANGAVVAYDKGDVSGRLKYIDYGLTVCSKTLFSALPEGQAIDLAAILAANVVIGQVAGYEVGERFYEIGSFQGILDLSIRLGTTA